MYDITYNNGKNNVVADSELDDSKLGVMMMTTMTMMTMMTMMMTKTMMMMMRMMLIICLLYTSDAADE